MDEGEFAQSRGDDDLFDDEIIPVDAAEDIVQQPDVPTPKLQDLTLENAPRGPAAASHHGGYAQRNERGSGRARGRGRGRGDSGSGQGGRGSVATTTGPAGSGLMSSKWATSTTPLSSKPTEKKDPPGTPESASEPITEVAERSAALPAPTVLTDPAVEIPGTTVDAITDVTEPQASENQTSTETTSSPPLPTAPVAPSKPVVQAVRGDRTATGGIKKPKLTEDELTAKLAAAKTRSQNLSAAHARAEADAASFAETERKAAEKRKEDRARTRVMEGEREANRQRKMKALGGREWDAEKEEDDFTETSRGRGRGGRFMRGAHGGVAGMGGVRDTSDRNRDFDTTQYEWQEGRGRGRGRGRGGENRGPGAPRGGARGGAMKSDTKPDLNAERDFPSLPPSSKPKNDSKAADHETAERPSAARIPGLQSPLAEGTTWADQMEFSDSANAKT